MSRYFQTLHRRSPHHKKRFAFLASSTITLIIFGVWSLATFSPQADQSPVLGDNNDSKNEIGPLESLGTSMAASFEALRANFGELKTGLGTLDLEAEYTEMKGGALEYYGQ